MRRRAVLACSCVVLLAACGPPIGVKTLGLRAAHEELTGNVLTNGRPSTASRIELQKRGLAEQYEADPAGTLKALHTATLVASRGDRDLLFAHAELSFDHALHGGSRSYYLAAVVHAWLYLFGPGAGAELDALDPKSRTAANLYNVGLARAFESKQRGEIVLRAGRRKLPFGTLDVAFDPASLRWGRRRLVRLPTAPPLTSGCRSHMVKNSFTNTRPIAPARRSASPSSACTTGSIATIRNSPSLSAKSWVRTKSWWRAMNRSKFIARPPRAALHTL